MCGRYLLDLPGSALAQAFAAVDGMPGFQPRFNVAPTSLMPILSVDAETGARVIEPATWGLIPGWARSRPGRPRPLINARAETIAEKASFRAAFASGRVLVPAMGIYEWQAPRTAASGGKTPYLIRVRGDAIDPVTGAARGHVAGVGEAAEPFTMAGIAETWVDGDGVVSVSYAIVTTRANDAMAPIHDRMPVILAGDQRAAWLDAGSNASELRELCEPCPSQWLEMWPVSRDVNHVARDDAHLTEPV